MILKGSITKTAAGVSGGKITLVLKGDSVFGFEEAEVTLSVPEETFRTVDVGYKFSMRLVLTETADGT